MRFRILLIVSMALSFAPSLLFADWADFVPQPFDNGAFFDAFTSFERDSSRSGRRPIRWTDTFVKERLSVYSNGYSYHPRFLLYHFSLGGAVNEEDYESTALHSRGWRYGSAFEYDATLLFLPEHPYNLELFDRRYEPLFKEQAATQHNAVETSRGASFRYRSKPYFLHANYVDDSIESGVTSSDVARAGVDGEYFKQLKNGGDLSFNGGFHPSWFSNSQGLDGTSSEYVLGNGLNLWGLRLNSSVSKTSFDEKNPSSASFDNDQLSWYELLSAYLPWSFRSDFSYRFRDNKGRIDNVEPLPDRTLSDKGKDFQFDLVHRLYQSLDTTYTFLRNSRTSFGGDTTLQSHSLALNYTKSIPRGRILAGVNGGTAETDNTGTADVINEPHSATAVPGSFTLSQQNVDPASIAVFLKSPFPPFEIILLTENVHYVRTPVLNSFEIHILTLPSQFALPGTFDFLVSYSLVTGTFGLRTDTLGSNASVQLFDELLTPYVSYSAVRSDVTSGTFQGIPIDSTTYTTGLIAHRDPLRVRGEYQEIRWDVSPYRAWRAEAQYVSALNPTTYLYGTVSYLNKYYSRGTSLEHRAPYTEQAESVSGSIQKQLFSRDLTFSAGGSYSRLQGLVDSNAYSANGSLTWKIGKMDLSIGASAYASDASAGANTISARRDHELFYMKIRRRLF